MPTTGAPASVWYPDDSAPIAPLENLFLQLATSVNVAFAALNQILVVSNIATLEAEAGAKIGDLAFMTTPGTGINPVYWQAVSDAGAALDWRLLSRVTASTKANLDSFTTAVGAGGDIQLGAGALAYVTATKANYSWDGTAWVVVGVFASAHGRALVTTTAGAGSVAPVNYCAEQSVVFPVGKFTLPPVISGAAVPTGSDVLIGFMAKDITKDGFNWRVYRLNAAPSVGSGINWTATQATATSATS